MKTATLLEQETFDNGISFGEWCLYRLNPPMDGHEYVRVSAAYVLFSGPETCIFPADETGEVASWGELDGSYKGGLSHEQALRNAGYEVTR